MSLGGSRQVNAVLCHPTWPVVIVGYEDGYIRLFNAKARKSNPISLTYHNHTGRILTVYFHTRSPLFGSS